MTATINVTANEFTFGVEIECYIPASIPVAVGGYHNGRQIAQLPTGWNAQADSSLCPEIPAGYKAIEVVSPILKGADGLRQVKAVCDWLNSVGAKVNRKCGFHVHVAPGSRDAEVLKKITTVVANHEKALFAATGTKSRETSHYCAPIQNAASYIRNMRDGCEPGNLSRYHSLNLTNIAHGGKPTVEFRAFSGTTNALKAISYVRMCLALVEKALTTKRLPKWTAKPTDPTSPIFRKAGEGSTALTRFLYTVGWTQGRADKVYGEVVGDDLPTIADSKAELVRLAAKYDSATA